MTNGNGKSLESWIWDAACSIRGAKDAAKFKDFIVGREEIAKNDFNISPSRYIHTGAGEEYRPIVEIVEELNALDEEAKETDRSLRNILEKICL